jgi:hypothetical protein
MRSRNVVEQQLAACMELGVHAETAQPYCDGFTPMDELVEMLVHDGVLSGASGAEEAPVPLRGLPSVPLTERCPRGRKGMSPLNWLKRKSK